LSSCCYATKANSTTIRSRVSQPAYAGKEADLVKCKLITACYQNSEPDSLCECHIGKQLPLQELTQLIKIKLLISRITETFCFLVPIARGGKCPFCPPPADAHDWYRPPFRVSDEHWVV